MQRSSINQVNSTDPISQIRPWERQDFFTERDVELIGLEFQHQQVNVFSSFARQTQFDPFERKGVISLFTDSHRNPSAEVGELVLVGCEPTHETRLVFTALKMLWRTPIHLTPEIFQKNLPDITAYQVVYDSSFTLDPDTLRSVIIGKCLERNGHINLYHLLGAIRERKSTDKYLFRTICQSSGPSAVNNIASNSSSIQILMNPNSPLGDFQTQHLDLDNVQYGMPSTDLSKLTGVIRKLNTSSTGLPKDLYRIIMSSAVSLFTAP